MKFHNFIQKYLAGGIQKPAKLFGKEVFINLPLVAPWFFVGVLLAGLFQETSFKDVPFLFWTGVVCLSVGLFGFFYWDIFPKQRKKSN